MQPKTPKWIEDIRSAAALIIKATTGKVLDDYLADPFLRSAVERQFEIIGEAMNRIARHDPETAARIGNYPNIIAFRNILIHGYDLVDNQRVWKVISDQLPDLLADVEAVLKQAP